VVLCIQRRYLCYCFSRFSVGCKRRRRQRSAAVSAWAQERHRPFRRTSGSRGGVCCVWAVTRTHSCHDNDRCQMGHSHDGRLQVGKTAMRSALWLQSRSPSRWGAGYRLGDWAGGYSVMCFAPRATNSCMSSSADVGCAGGLTKLAASSAVGVRELTGVLRRRRIAVVHAACINVCSHPALKPPSQAQRTRFRRRHSAAASPAAPSSIPIPGRYHTGQNAAHQVFDVVVLQRRRLQCAITCVLICAKCS